jgi:hypothetical protein
LPALLTAGNNPARNIRRSEAQSLTIRSTLNAPRVPIHRFSPTPRRAWRFECSKRLVSASWRA